MAIFISSLTKTASATHNWNSLIPFLPSPLSILSVGIPSFCMASAIWSSGRLRYAGNFSTLTPSIECFLRASRCAPFKVTPNRLVMASTTLTRSLAFSMLMNTLPSLATLMVSTSFSGTLISETDPGVFTFTGSFFTNVDVNMKNVSRSTMTSDIGVMSIQTSFFSIFTLPIAINF